MSYRKLAHNLGHGGQNQYPHNLNKIIQIGIDCPQVLNNSGSLPIPVGSVVDPNLQILVAGSESEKKILIRKRILTLL
jgi:hypothetical protein